MSVILDQMNSAGQRFIESAVPMLAQSSLLIVILLLVDVLLRKKVRAVFRYWIWMLVLLKLVLPTSLSTPVSLGHWLGEGFAWMDAGPMIAAHNAAGINPDKQALAIPVTPGAESSQPISEVVGSPGVPVAQITWRGIVFFVWLVVVMVMTLLLLQRSLFVGGLVARASEADGFMNDTLAHCCHSMGVRRKVGLRISTHTASPAVCRLFRPVILLPQNLMPSLEASQLSVVLIHELAHLKRFDLWVNFGQTLLQIVYFYNPLLWLANAIIRRAREQAVDEAVLVAMGEKAQLYPQTLVNVAKLAFRGPTLSLRLIGVVESKSLFEWRIRTMLNRPIPKSSKVGVLGTIVIFAVAAVLLPMARAQKVDAGSKPVATENEGKPTKPLLEAAADGDVHQIRLHLLTGTDVNMKNGAGVTALHSAAQEGYTEIVRLLIAQGADVNAKNADGETPLHRAAVQGRIETAELLIAKGADVNARNNKGWSPVSWALLSTGGGRQMVELLVGRGAKVSAVHLAAHRGDIDKVRSSLEEGTSVDARDEAGRTLLHYAASAGHTHMVEFLIAKGAEVDARDKHNRTPLFYAGDAGWRNVAELLLAKGANVNTRNEGGDTPLESAAWRGHGDVAKLLIAKGADVRVKTTKWAYTPLHAAVSTGLVEVAELLISKGSDLDAKTDWGATPLLCAIDDAPGESRYALAKLLIEKGAHVNATADNKSGSTALHYAAMRNPPQPDLVRLLIAKGADLNANDKNGETPLHACASHGHKDIVELLLTEGADVNAKTKAGRTPLQMAEKYGRTEIVELLRKHGAKE